MVKAIDKTPPRPLTVTPDGIPKLMKTLDRWVVWQAVPKDNGKFDKVPTDPATGRKLKWSDPTNWMGFDAALASYKSGEYGGMGIVLSDKHPIEVDGREMYLVALDYDGVTKKDWTAIREEWLGLGKPYAEKSPSGRGLRMFALSFDPPRGGNNGNGCEMYSRRRFMTVTGQGGKGNIKDTTAPLKDLERKWFPARSSGPLRDLEPNLVPSDRAETEKNVALVREALFSISPDCSYEVWRNIIWAAMSTGWDCAVDLTRKWSVSVQDIEARTREYDERAFETVVSSYEPTGGITLGTLFHHANEAGWKRPQPSVAEPASELPPEPPTKRLRGLLTPEQVKSLPSAPYRVRGLLPRRGVAAIYGESGSGKSFLVMDLIFAVAAGHDNWFDLKIKKAPVAYVALEGRGGIAKRIKAWEVHHCDDAPDDARIWLELFTLLDPEHVDLLAEEIAAQIGKGGVVVVDTLNQAAPGKDENNSADMSTIIGNAKRLADMIDGLVILIHHSGKDRSKGLRGHSSLIAALDAAIEVTKCEASRSWKVTKAKDDIDGVTYDFDLKPYTVQRDEDGLDVTSCAITRALHPVVKKVRPPSGKNQKACMIVMKHLSCEHPGGVSEKTAIAEVAAKLDCDEGRRTNVAKDTIRKLIDRGNLHEDKGMITTS